MAIRAPAFPKGEGRRFGRLIVLERSDDKIFKTGRARRWKCRCDCGKEIITYAQTLKCGETQSCGGRVYVTVGGKKDLHQIVYFDKENKRAKTIDLDHTHKGMNEHTHHGYYHYEYDAKNGVKKLATNLTPEEKRMVDRVRKLWYNHKHKR